MRMLFRWTGWSLIVIASLLVQSLPVSSGLAPSVAAAQQPAASGAQVSLATMVTRLERALERLEASGSGASAAPLADVERAWQTLLLAERQVREDAAATQQRLTAAGHSVAAERQATTLEEHKRRMSTLTARYSELLAAARQGHQSLKQAAATLRGTLQTSMGVSDTSAPNLDLLPNRPAPQAAPVEQRPALRPALAEAQTLYGTLPHASPPPGPPDLASTVDAALTPEIQALANQLGRAPVRIYSYVHDQIAFEPYYGSRKGALLTLWERSGNDIDTASLLIALLRASGISARYVRGTVAVDEARARNWVGNAPDLATAASMLATGGVPVSLTSDRMLVKEHVWVQAYIEPPNFRVYLPMVHGLGNPEVRATSEPATAALPAAAPLAASWIALDASFKQYRFVAPLDTAALTGFDAERWIDEMRATTPVSDELQAVYGLPRVPDPAEPQNDDAYREYIDLKAEQAVSRTMEYIAARPEMTNVDLLGGGYIVPASGGLPGSLPLEVVPNEPITEWTEVPDTLRDKLTVAIVNGVGTDDFSYQSSFPALANKRITVSYEAATPQDQAVIDSNGGSLLTTPPTINLVPVLRLNGQQVARGSPVRMGTPQTRSLTFIDARGRATTVQNSISAGETIAVGLAYGRTSSAAIEASQQRLAAAREALPKTEAGDPDLTHPANMAEPIIGEMLNLSILAYFNQLDTISEVVARGRDLRWFRYLSGGVAMQNLVFGYLFGAPYQTRGGGMGFDIQQNVVSAFSLKAQPPAARENDARVFLRTTGYVGSALEHSIFENMGKGAVSSIRLLRLALDRGIPVYQIDQTNRAQILPRLQLSPAVENSIVQALDQGQVVTTPEQEIDIDDWSGVGWILTDPATGAAAYLISGGLFGNTGTTNGGSFWDILKTVAAYAWLAINIGLDLWGIWAGIGLLLVPEPTLLTKIAGIALIAANLAALGFDIADLMDLASGEKSEQAYIGEQITGLIIGAILKRLGIAAAARIVRELGSGQAGRVARQLGQFTGGATDRMLARGFTQNEIVDYSARLATREAWEAVDSLGQRQGNDVVRSLMNNPYMQNQGAIERVARAINDAPNANGIADTIRNAVSRQDFGYAYELQRAIANRAAGQNVVEYGRRIDVSFQRVTGFNPDGTPIRGAIDTQPLEGDLVLTGNIFVDAKHGAQGNQELRIWNQIVKAQQAIDQGLISGYRFECSSTMGQFMQNWARTNAPDVQFVTRLGDGLP